MKPWLPRFWRCLLMIVTIIAVLTPTASALDDDEFDGYAADALTIRVGYFGGPYYEKAVFTLDELWAMDVVYADYTFIDNMPSVVIDHVAGVRLADLMDAAGIDLNSIQTFYFWTRDKQSDYFTSYSKTALIDAAGTATTVCRTISTTRKGWETSTPPRMRFRWTPSSPWPTTGTAASPGPPSAATF